MSKNKKCFSVVCSDKKMPKLKIWSCRTHFLIFQLFVVLLVLQTPAWAALSSLTALDANGDSIFNSNNERLTISFTTSDHGEDTQKYTYEIKLADGRKITSGQNLTKNEIIQYEWDGTVEIANGRVALPDGEYTITVKITGTPPLPTGQVSERTTNVTIDKTKPTIDDVSVEYSAFSPIIDSIPVYYTLSEEVAEAWLEILRAADGEPISRRIELDKTEGSHTFKWDGTDGNQRSFEDGNYRLKLYATDKAGNTAEPKTTEQITIDSEEPQITDILINDSIPIVKGTFVNASIETISFTVDAGGNTPLSSNDSNLIQIKPVGGTNLSGTLVTVNNKATFTLENSIDDVSENGTYEVTASVPDRVGNVATKTARFTFDNTAPTLKSISTNREEFKHGSGLNGQTNYVEAELEDNFELDLSTSSIRLIGPDGNLVLGQQTLSTNNRIRWQLRSPLLARDGIHDGHYSVQIIGADKANNRTETINIAFVFDNLAPELVSLQPTRNADTFDFLGDTAYYNLPLNQFVATFNDGDTGTGVLFSGEQDVTSIIFGTPRADGNIDEISGRVFPDKANNVLTYILNSPLIKTDGSQDGNYIISVKAADTIGNVNITQYQIIYDTQVPTLKSTLPAANQTVSTLSEVVIKLDETTSGIDFSQSNFRLTRNEGGNQVDVPVNISSNGTDTITLTLLQEIAVDGSDDGTYTIEITPSDRAGNMGAAVRRQFYLVSKTQPRVRLTTPETGTVNNLSDISAVIDNYIGSGINFDDSTITVSNADGIVVPDSKVEYDAANNQLTWSTETSIPRNGTADGEYSILVVYVDFSGKEFIQSFPLNLDTQYPSINTVEVGTDPQRKLSIDSELDITETFSQINITFAESDVDFENTPVSLAGPDGTNIALHQSNDGENRLTLNFQNLSSLGTYTLSVTPTDNIGNVSQVPFIYRFDLDIAVPVVTSVLIGGQSGAVVYVNENAGEIVANLVDTTGIGLAIGEGESDIVVTSSIGLPVPGITTENNENQLIWRPTALPTDGSGDGRYIVAVTPVDNAGRTGDVAYRSFIYDTQKPRLTSATPITLHQPISYIGGSLANFQFGIEDVGPASFDLDAQTISLQKVDGDVVIGQTTHDGVNQVFFTLSAPLPADGSADGEYLLTVNLVDKSGNQNQIQHSVFYDSQVPVLSTVSLNTKTPLDLTPYLVTDLDETVNRITLNFVDSTRVDFINTTITLTGPDGSDIPLNLDNNGVDQLTASFASLNQDGLYTLSVSAQDITGNADQGAVRYPFRIMFEIPELSSVKANTTDTAIDLIPNEIVDIVDVINQVTLQFTDPSRLDHENTQVELLDPNGQQIHLTQEEDVSSQLIVRFISVTENGVYTLIVTPHDMDGNVAQLAERYQFRLDIAFPSVSSVLIDGQLSSAIYVNDAVATIVATFIEPAGVGLDFSDDGSSIVVTNQNGVEVIGTTESNEQNQLTWTPLALPTDGSADGTYNVSVTPLDKIGRTGKVVNRQFAYDTQLPRITSATPIALHQPITYIGGSLTQFQLTVQDVGPASLNLDEQTITLQTSEDETVLGQLTNDGDSQLYFTLSTPLPTDGSADGEYTLTVTLVDNAGNSDKTTHNVYYDSQAPTLSTVTLNTETPLNLTPYETTELTESVSKLTLKFVETTQVDFENTNVTLSGPGGSSVPLTLTDNGVDELTASFVALTQGGQYTLSVTPKDIAGNMEQGAVQYPFRLDFPIPELTSVKANTTNETIALTPYEIVEITETVNSFVLEFTDAMRIDIEETNIELSGPNGEQIAATLEEGEGSQLVVRFVSLMQSGNYRFSITPQDTVGNVAQSATQYQFRLDFPIPELTSVKANTTNETIALTPYEIVEIAETVNSFTLEFTDAMRIDIEETNIELSGPNGEQIATTLEEGQWSQLIVRFVSLMQSGNYRFSITPQDIGGNVAQSATQYQFRLDFPIPELTSVKASTSNDTIALTPYEIVEIAEIVNSFVLEFTDVMRIDIEETNIELSGPNGEQIAATLEEGEGSQLVVRFVSLMQSGNYRFSITPQDTVGNVAQNSTQYQFRLKLQVPHVTSVNAIVTDVPVTLTPYEIINISNSFSRFTVEFNDTTNLDSENTNITLSGPNGQEIFTTLEEGEDSKYIVRFVELTGSGVYTISVTPQDKAGNVAQSATQFQFRLDIAGPSVQSVSIDGKLGSTVYVSNSSPRIIASFTDSLGVGLSFGENGTNIEVTDSEELKVPGTTTTNDSNQLIWTPIPFATDGSADGQYSVAITPVDMNGRTGTVVNRKFIYDSQAPRITAAAPITLHAPVSYIGSGLTEFVLTIQDEGPAGFVLSSQVAALMDASNKPVPATITHNELTNQLYLTLTTPFANDGSADGTYTLSVALTDKAGNRKNSQFAVVYDSRVPQISSVKTNTVGVAKELIANEVTELSESISTITLSFSEATRVDFINTVVSLLDPSDLSVPLSIEDNGVSEMTISFPNLTEIGQYTLSVTPQDIAGNTASSPVEFTFNLEFILPTIESILIGDTVTLSSGDIAYVNADNLLIVANLLDPVDTGLSFDRLTGSSILVTTLDGTTVFGSLSTNNVDVIAWEPITLSTDGSSDGRYAVYVSPVDKQGRQGSTIYREFILDTQEPEITSASPINLSQPVSYVSESLTQIQFTVQDVGPADLVLEDQQVSLRNQSGAIIPTKLTNDSQNQIYLTLDEPLPLDGSRDGEYTVVVEFADKAGNMLSLEHPIIYDTQAPTLVSTVPADGELLTEDLTQIVVNLNDEGDSGIDWALTTVTLVDPNGAEISGEVTSNGKTQLTLNTNQLVADGRYIIRVQAIDRAGNGNRSIFESSFLLSRRLPAVISTTPLTAPEDEAYTNETVEEIEVLLETVDERHLSTVRLLNADGQVIAGQQQRQADRLIYQLVRPLATDGSDDGLYTIEFTPISASGRTGEVQNLVFTYDTQAPELIPDDIQLIVTEPEVNNSLVEIRVVLTDEQAGIDWENLDEEWFTFEQLTPDTTDIAGRLSYDAEQNILIFRLTVPLADNGSADGEYRITITPIDKADNGNETYEKDFTYDTSPPVIDPATLLLNDAPLLTDRDAVDYPSAISTTGGVVVQASITDVGLGVNLSQSSITIRNPNGQEIPGTSQQNGIDTIVFKSDGLNDEGIYQVTITSVGNDSELLGFSPKDSITAAFLYETTEPTATVINDGGKTEFTDEAIPFEGTAADPQGTRRAGGQQGENEIPVPASGVLLVEIVGTGPDGQEIEPVPAEDDSNAQAQPWSTWSVDFLPTRSGEYDLDLRVTDKAGNYTVYDIGEYTMSVSFSFKGKTFGWPNPLRKSKDGVAFFSFDLNAPEDEAIDMTLYIYDWGGDLVYKQKYANITTGKRDDTRIKWNLENQAGNAVARGIYVFRLEAVNGAGNRANAVGKVLVVD